MLLLSVRYSETAINVNIFMRDGLAYLQNTSFILFTVGLFLLYMMSNELVSQQTF